MIPVFQDRHGFGQGNCVWACVASIFEIPLDTLRYPPADDADLEAWTVKNRPSLVFHHLDFAYDFEVVEGYPDIGDLGGTGRWSYKVPEEWEAPFDPGPWITPAPLDFWIASIPSPGLERPVEDPYYPMPALHAVVMYGKELVHDPHADYECPRKIETVERCSWWTRR